MDFEFSGEQLAFVEEVEKFLDLHDTPDVMDVRRENMAQIVDTPAETRLHEAKLAAQGLAGNYLAEGIRRLRKGKASTSTC